MIRIYNPTKNAKEHDSEGIFIKKWIPKLKEIPTPLVFEPWKLSEIDQETFNFNLDLIYSDIGFSSLKKNKSINKKCPFCKSNII